MTALDSLNKSRMTFGVELPLDNDWTEAGRKRAKSEGRAFGVPSQDDPAILVKRAEDLGMDAVWVRDVPVHDPAFGDAGQVFDPFPLLGYLAAQTDRIALGTAAIVAPLRQPILLAKMAATIHELSGGRLILGLASGDRPVEYPLMGLPFQSRGETLRDQVATLRHLWAGGTLDGPKGPVTVRPLVGNGPPLVMAGMGQQTIQWVAREMDGWFTYPGPPDQAHRRLSIWRKAREEAGRAPAPVLTAMHLDLDADPTAPAEPIQFGLRVGRHALIDHVLAMRRAGVAHLSFNFRQSRRTVVEAMEDLARNVLPAINLEKEILE